MNINQIVYIYSISVSVCTKTDGFSTVQSALFGQEYYPITFQEAGFFH